MIASINSTEAKVLKLKSDGNEAFLKGSKLSNTEEGCDYLKRACVLYGEAINLILLLESNLNADDVELALHDAFMVIRPTLFLNLAASNLKLNAADGALQCCNSAIQLCNAPGLLYADLASSKDVVDIVHPVAQAMLQTMTKALFRRGTCYEALGDVDAALKDYRAAVSISPDNQELKLLIEAAEVRVRCTTNTEDKKASNHSAESARPAARRDDGLSKESMSVNGGRCWMRKGLWSQTVTDVIVYFPLQVVYLELYAEDGERTTTDLTRNYKLMRKTLKVAFKNHSITISLSSSKESNRSITIDLEHAVISSECTWTLDLDSDPTLNSGNLIIYLSKAPKFEWFPGQEWWDRVCQGDESIDTTCCTLGADVSQLPVEAKLKAQRESCRFQDLSEKQRREEIQLLVKAKQDMRVSQVRTSAAVEQEDDALNIVPERAGMLEAMRKEFPHIDITTK